MQKYVCTYRNVPIGRKIPDGAVSCDIRSLRKTSGCSLNKQKEGEINELQHIAPMATTFNPS